MEFRTPSQFDNNGFNTQSPIVGGAGYNPAPQSFSYNGNGYYNTQPNGYYSQPGFINPPGGYVSSYGGPQYGNMYQQQQYRYNSYQSQYYEQPQWFDESVNLRSDQFYFQLGYKQPMVIGLDGKPIPMGNNNYYTNAWDQYNRRKQQEQEWQEHNQQQREIWKMLTVMNRKWQGFDDGEEYFEQQEQQRQLQLTIDYERYNQEQQIMALNRIRMLPNSSDPNYINYEQNQYVERWNKLYDKRTEKYQGDISLYDFFNGGVANEMWIDMLTEQAIDRAKDMSKLYNQNSFRQELAKSNPNYDPLTGVASGKLTLNGMSGSRGLNIDDMEITLPPQIAKDYEARRAKFMNTILSNMKDNVSPLANQNYMRERQNGTIVN